MATIHWLLLTTAGLWSLGYFLLSLLQSPYDSKKTTCCPRGIKLIQIELELVLLRYNYYLKGLSFRFPDHSNLGTM